MLSACPRIIGSCRSGIDTPSDEKLIAARYKDKEIKQQLGLTSLGYISHEGFKQAVADGGINPDHCCFACMDLQYFHE